MRENPHGVELRTARRGGFAADVPRRARTNALRGQVGAPASVSVTDAISDAATPEGPQADDACVRPAAGARVAVSPRSPWTTNESALERRDDTLASRSEEQRDPRQCLLDSS